MDDSRHCAKHWPSLHHQRHLKLFPQNGPLDFIAVDILGPLPRAGSGHQYGVAATDSYLNVTQKIPISKTSIPYVVTILFGSWIVPCGIASFPCTENGPQIVVKLFGKLWSDLNVTHLATTAYHQLKSAKSSAETRVWSPDCVIMHENVGRTGTNVSDH